MYYRIIVNPTAGRGGGELAVPRIENLLRDQGLDYELVRTERPWHAAELAQEAAEMGVDVVVAVGGGRHCERSAQRSDAGPARATYLRDGCVVRRRGQ